MIGDNPAVTKKLPKSKTSWTEMAFAKAYNSKSRAFKLLWAGSDYNHFDFWLMPRNRQEPARLVELKYHENKKAFDRPYVGCDALKIQRILGLAIGTKAYVFHLFEDQTLIQNCRSPIEKHVETIWDGVNTLLAMVHVKHTISIPIAAADLRAQRDAELQRSHLHQSHGATVLGFEAPAVPRDSHE